MTTPGGIPTFGSPMGGGRQRASEKAAADLAKLATLSATYKANMSEALKSARAQTAELKKQTTELGKQAKLGGGSVAGRSTGNGGGARMPSYTATMAKSTDILEQYDTRTGPVPYETTMAKSRAIRNGGGASITAAGSALGRVGSLGVAAGAAAFSAAMLNPETYKPMDFLANRASRISGNPYSKSQGARMISAAGANSFRSPEEMMSFFQPLITDNRTGFLAGSQQHNRMTEGARITAALNPLAAASAGQTSVNFQKPELFNMARMTLGIETIGRNGQPKTPDQIAREMVGSMGGSSSKPMTAAQTAATLGETGMMRLQMRQLGMDENMQSAISQYLTESAGGSSYTSSSAIQRSQAKGTKTMYRSDQRTASAQQDLVGSTVESYSAGYEASNAALRKAMETLEATISGMPDMLRDALVGSLGLLGGAGAAGGAIGGAAAVGAGKGIKGLARRGVGAVGKAGRVARLAGGGLIGAGLMAGYEGIRGARGADYSGGMLSDFQSMWEHGAGRHFGYERGDGPGRGPRFGTASFPGVAGAEMGDSDKGGGGRGKGTIDYLKQLMARSGLPHRITSTKRSGSGGSYHNTGHAIDIAGPTPGVNTKEMLAINRYLATKLGKGAKELIYSGPGATNLYNGQPHTYGASVRKNHHNHVHVAVTEESLKGVGQSVGEGDGGFVQVGGRYRRAAKKGNGKGSDTGLNRRGSQGRGVGYSERRLIDDVLGGIGSRGGAAAGIPGADPLEAVSTDGGSTTGGVGSAAGSAGAHAIDKFLLGLRMHESRGDYTAENGGTRGSRGANDSSASGAYQYLDGTWANYRGFKYAAAAPPTIQDERARQDASRMYSKYGNWRQVAAAHFQGEGWLRKNPDPSKWDAAGNRSAGNPRVSSYVKDVLARGGLPETGDGPGGAIGQTADVPEPRHMPAPGGGHGGGGGNVQVRQGSRIHIAKVEVNLTTPQVSEAEAARIGKRVIEQIARQAQMSEMSS